MAEEKKEITHERTEEPKTPPVQQTAQQQTAPQQNAPPPQSPQSPQAQMAALMQQLGVAQAIAVKEKNRSEELANLVNRMQDPFNTGCSKFLIYRPLLNGPTFHPFLRDQLISTHLFIP